MKSLTLLLLLSFAARADDIMITLLVEQTPVPAILQSSPSSGSYQLVYREGMSERRVPLRKQDFDTLKTLKETFATNLGTGIIGSQGEISSGVVSGLGVQIKDGRLLYGLLARTREIEQVRGGPIRVRGKFHSKEALSIVSPASLMTKPLSPIPEPSKQRYFIQMSPDTAVAVKVVGTYESSGKPRAVFITEKDWNDFKTGKLQHVEFMETEADLVRVATANKRLEAVTDQRLEEFRNGFLSTEKTFVLPRDANTSETENFRALYELLPGRLRNAIPGAGKHGGPCPWEVFK